MSVKGGFTVHSTGIFVGCNVEIYKYNIRAIDGYRNAAFCRERFVFSLVLNIKLAVKIFIWIWIAGIRGGVSQCMGRYAAANNRYMQNYDKERDDCYLVYFDVNNLYGWAMMQSLPYGGFRWVEDLNDSQFFWNIPEDSEIGYFLEVDLDYPENLHDKHNDLPFCPESRAAPSSKQKKLMTTLYNKEKYVLHYRVLQQAIKHGLVLKKIHRALKFNQKPWLKSYIDFNSAKRKDAKNDFEKMLYKLLNNSVYGKTMENERKRLDVKLVHKWEGRYSAEARISHPTFHSCAIFDENLVAIQLQRTTVNIKKPIYVGLAVLDISKTCLYKFHYNFMKEHLFDFCKLLYTDTDSLIYAIYNYDIYQFMKKYIEEFDTSDYPTDNRFSIPLMNKKIPGKMKVVLFSQI